MTLPEHEEFRTRETGISYNIITDDYLATLEVPLIKGRQLSRNDRAGAPRVLLVNQAFVKQFFRVVLKLVAREGAKLAALGGIIGLALALVAGRLLASQLFGVSPFDPIIAVAVLLILGGVTLVASLIPGRRAARVDPMIALRTD